VRAACAFADHKWFSPGFGQTNATGCVIMRGSGSSGQPSFAPDFAGIPQLFCCHHERIAENVPFIHTNIRKSKRPRQQLSANTILQVMPKISLSLLTPAFQQLVHYRSLALKFEEYHHRPCPHLYWRWFWSWHQSIWKKRTAVLDRQPWVTFDSKKTIGRFARPGAKVFEFGMGGSTLYFLDCGCEVISVDHDREWFDRATQIIGHSPRWEGRLIEPEPISLAEHRTERYRSGESPYEASSFELYVKSLTSEPDECFDVIMIDGRARVDAAIASAPKIRPGGGLILDNSERDRYAMIHRYFSELKWKPQRFPGPGPYVWHEFWETTVWTKPQ
jgi:hypothetical protein